MIRRAGATTVAAVSPSPGSTPAPPVRLVDLAEQHRRLQAEIEAAVLRVLRSGVYILGPEVSAFEEELAAACGARHAVACASGTGALTLSLLSLGLAPGDEVIVPSFTIFVDAEVVSLVVSGTLIAPDKGPPVNASL